MNIGELADRTRFPSKSAYELFAIHHVFMQDLHGQSLVCVDLLDFEHTAHAAARNQALNSIPIIDDIAHVRRDSLFIAMIIRLCHGALVSFPMPSSYSFDRDGVDS